MSDPCTATEAYEGLLLTVALAAHQKAAATISYAASMNSPPETLDLGAAMAAIGIMLADIHNFVSVNTEDKNAR